MADVITNVTTVDIQMLDADRSNATTIKLDNPKENLTREQVSAAMQPAFSNGWFLTNKGSVAMYLGDVTINQSIKTKLGGDDFYVTPSTLTLSTDQQYTVTVSGATIQGYDILNVEITPERPTFNVQIADNGLTVTIQIPDIDSYSGTFTFRLIIQGTSIDIPCTISV